MSEKKKIRWDVFEISFMEYGFELAKVMLGTKLAGNLTRKRAAKVAKFSIEHMKVRGCVLIESIQSTQQQ